MKRFLYLVNSLLLLSSLLISGASAQEFQKIGTTGFVFLEIPVTARQAALGETGITLTNAATDGLYINPALTVFSASRFAATASYANWYVQTRHQALGLIYQIPLFGTIGFQAIYFDFGDIPQTRNPLPTEIGSYVDLGTFSAGALALGFSYARALTDKFAFGASLKLIRENIDSYTAQNVITDIGFLYQTGFNSLRIGAFLQNFGLESKYADEKFKMPQQLKLGISGEVWGRADSPNHMTLLAEAVHPNDADERIHIGMETLISQVLFLRAGYKFGYEDENLCLGAGLRLSLSGKKLGLDFSYMNHERLDTSLRSTIALEF